MVRRLHPEDPVEQRALTVGQGRASEEVFHQGRVVRARPRRGVAEDGLHLRSEEKGIASAGVEERTKTEVIPREQQPSALGIEERERNLSLYLPKKVVAPALVPQREQAA